MRRLALLVAATCSVLYAMGSVVMAEMKVPPKPENGGYVRDETSTLSSAEIQNLNEKIQGYRERTGVQLAVLMVPTITDDYLENFSLNVARTWGVGEAGKNNGALLLIAKNDRKLRIEVGSGLEGDLTDVRASRIIRDRITPQFKKGDFYRGIIDGLDGMSLAIGGAPDALLTNDQTSTGFWGNVEDIVTGIFFVGFFGITWLGAILGRSERWWPGGIIGGVAGSGAGYLLAQGSVMAALISGGVLAVIGLMFDFLVSKNFRSAVKSGGSPAWWAGGTTIGPGSSGGSSGFGGFGGGGFSGGGSSGSW